MIAKKLEVPPWKLERGINEKWYNRILLFENTNVQTREFAEKRLKQLDRLKKQMRGK
jgi:hypothetical protein